MKRYTKLFEVSYNKKELCAECNYMIKYSSFGSGTAAINPKTGRNLKTGMETGLWEVECPKCRAKYTYECERESSSPRDGIRFFGYLNYVGDNGKI